MTSGKAEETWRNIWNKTSFDRIPEWDQLSNLIFYFLCTIIPSFTGKRILEAGSGTGRISVKLARLKGAKVVLIDVSRRITKYSLKLARQRGVSAEFIVASILSLPIRPECLDIVWSSGVLEHFGSLHQQLAISEFMRCLKNSGLSIIIVPNRNALVYNWLRILSMKLGKWPLGYEEPLSKKDMEKFQPTPHKVYSNGFFQQFSIIFVPYVSVFLKHLLRTLHWVLGKEFYLIDRKLAGYLLIGLFIKS